MKRPKPEDEETKKIIHNLYLTNFETVIGSTVLVKGQYESNDIELKELCNVKCLS